MPQPTDLEALLEAGIAAAKAKQTAQARTLLTQVVEADEENLQAWLWLSGVVESLEDKLVCLENVLALDPDNAPAQKGLAWVRGQLLMREVQPAEPVAPAHPAAEPASVSAEPTTTFPPPEPAAMEPTAIAPEPAPAIASRPPASSSDPWGSPNRCPYCGVDTAPEARRCPSCHRSLFVKVRKVEKASGWHKALVVIWGIRSTIQFIVGPLVPVLMLLTWSDWITNSSPSVQLLLAQFGPADLEALRQMLIIWAILGSIQFILPLAMTIGLSFRVRLVYFLAFGAIALNLLLTVLQIFMGIGMSSIVCVGINALIIVGELGLLFMASDDFASHKVRVYVEPDSGISTGSSYFERGKVYAKQGMWALAVAQWRKAVALSPGVVGYSVTLARGYTKLGDKERALHTLREATNIAPHDAKLAALVREMEASIQ